MHIALSDIDRQRFGVTVAKTTLAGGDAVAAVMDWCADAAVALLIARCPTTELALAQRLEQAGCFLTDTLVYYRKQAVDAGAAPLPDGYSTRLATPADADAVERLAGATFAGYLGHYHTDARLRAADADLVYSSWAASSCRSPAVADAVVLIEHAGGIVAFATLKTLADDRFEGVLFGVHPAHQGKRLYQALMRLAQQWGGARALATMVVSTQVTNVAVQKVWCRQGFEPSDSFYTFHKWFDAPAR
ncbi:Ribosomal protein S18 acetylase RimI [Duganella sp. CF517]|uniref:GNAT family N-acetyltransferase n=1 Tax=Duganella sp. CF517 TaxID=1881038 RepID=UPI0008B189EF|nr:GNAT family N-acetyltransferase [Duganella sp. CF517]SEO21197.1 Ribosomal protein S18 acetylase RimI [Duganella sp. CF517]